MAKTILNLYNVITESETATGNQVDLKQSLVLLVDEYLQGVQLTKEQGSELARLRASIIIGLTNF